MAGKGYKGGRPVVIKRFGKNHDGINWPSDAKPASNDAKPASDGGEAVKEIMRLVGEQCKGKPRYYWECECVCGSCDFATKAGAMDNNHGKFCGAGATVKRRKAK